MFIFKDSKFIFTDVNENMLSKIAAKLASMLFRGSAVLLFGDLGAGKTTFTRYLVSALDGEPRQVTSPTFTIVNEYKARMNIYHVDLFRLKASELEELPINDYIESDGVCVIEWPDKLGQYMPDDFFEVRLDFKDEKHRNVVIASKGTKCGKLLKNRGEIFVTIQET